MGSDDTRTYSLSVMNRPESRSAIQTYSEFATDFRRTALVFGAGAYEEILFRVGAYSLLFLLARQSGTFFGLPPRGAALAAEGFALVTSSVLFAAFHLEGMLAWLGRGGEPFELARFLWRALAGLLLGVLFRWRGAGVAAWTHALFNVSLLLGAGPGVFLEPP